MKMATIVPMGYVIFVAFTTLAASDGNVRTSPPSPQYSIAEQEKPKYERTHIKFVSAASMALMFGGIALDLLPVDWQSGNIELKRPDRRTSREAWGSLPVPEGVESIIAIRQQNVIFIYGTSNAIYQLKELISFLDQPVPLVDLDLILVIGDPKMIPHKAGPGKSISRSEKDWNAAWEELKRLPSSANWKVCLNTTVGALNDVCTSVTTDIPGGDHWAELDVTPLLEAAGGVSLRTTLALRPGHGELQSVLNARNREIVSLRGLRVDERRELMIFIRPRIEISATAR